MLESVKFAGWGDVVAESSRDGIHWDIATIPFNDNLVALATDSLRTVAVGLNGSIVVSR